MLHVQNHKLKTLPSPQIETANSVQIPKNIHIEVLKLFCQTRRGWPIAKSIENINPIRLLVLVKILQIL